MSNQLFIDSDADSASDSYVDFFKDSIGQGPGKYYSGIGEVYRSGSRYQKGYGLLGTSSYYYRGEGFGNILSSLWKMAYPMLKTGAKTLGTAALDVATNVASDALQGKNIAESAKQHLTDKGTELIQSLQQQQQNTPSPAETAISAPPPSVSKTPTFRRLPRKRTGQVTFAKPSKQSKRFPALKYM